MGAVLLGVSALILLRRILFTWPGLLLGLAASVMFIPARRYALPIPLPFQLEPYRLMILIAVVAVALAFLLDRRRRWQPIAFGWPLGIFVATLVVSFIVNGMRLVEESLVTTSLSGFFQLGIILSVFVAVRQLLTSERMTMLLLASLSWMGVVVAIGAVFERVTRLNVFQELGAVLPLTVLRDAEGAIRAGVTRASGSAQHPIALAVMLCMLIPVMVYLAKHAGWPRNGWNRRIVYGLGVVVLFAGIVAAISRTAVVVLAVMLLMTLVLRPRIAMVMIAFAVPTLVLATAVVPNQVDSMLGSFLNLDELIASQYTSPGMSGAGRLADLEPTMAQVEQVPFFGLGYGSRIVIGEDRNSYILDNQFLSILLEAGALGVVGFAVFMLAPIGMLLAAVFRRRFEPRYAELAIAIAIALTGYTASVFFFDAFWFFQSSIVHMFLLAVGAWVLTAAPRRDAVGIAPRKDAVRMPRAGGGAAGAPAAGGAS